MILIHDGYMIDPKSGREGNYDILIDGDKIVKIAEKIEPRGKVTRINAEGLLVAPGLVDVHVHFRDPGFTAKEDINTGAAAAAKGGVTTVVLMANTKPAVDSEETLHYILDKGAKTGIHVTTCANVTMGMQGKQLTDMKKLAVAGAVGFTDDGVPLLDAELAKVKWFSGDEFGVGDIAIAPFIYNLFNVGLTWTPRPNLQRWYQQLTERPAVRKVVMIPVS